jgi:hypothetical protein
VLCVVEVAVCGGRHVEVVVCGFGHVDVVRRCPQVVCGGGRVEFVVVGYGGSGDGRMRSLFNCK